MIYKLQGGNTLPSLLSILLLLRREGKRNEPKEDAWEKEKKRILKETDKIKQENSWMGKTADVLHHIGVGATGLGLLGSLITAPAATALGLAGGIGGEKSVNKGLGKLADMTGSKVRSWNDLTSKYLGWSPTLLMLTNPGTLLGGVVGGKAGSAILKRIPVHLDRNAAGDWTGWINIGNKLIRPSLNTLSANSPTLDVKDLTIEKLIHNTLMNVAVKASKLLAMNKLDKTAIDGFVSKLKDYLSEQLAKEFIKRSLFFLKGDKAAREIEKKAILNIKNKKGSNLGIEKALQEEAALTPEGRLNLLQKQYHPKMQLAFDRVKAKYKKGIDWNWENGGYFAEMPTEFKMKPLYDPNVKGISDKRPFIQRFYENVSKIIEEGGLMDLELAKGNLRLNKNNLWEGLVGEEFRKVDPTLYIVSKLKNFRESGNRVTTREEGIPYHGTLGTKLGNSEWSELSKKYALGASGNDAIFTVILDDMPGVGSMMTKYRGKGGVSIPFFRRAIEHPDYPVMDASAPEIKKYSHGHYSNDYGIWGELRSYFRGGGNGGWAQEVKRVTDPQSSGQAVNEYNFGSGTWNTKSLWNTLDFEPSHVDPNTGNLILKSPFAYNDNKSKNNGQNYIA